MKTPEEIYEEMEKKEITATPGKIPKTKVYFAVNVGFDVGRNIEKVKEICRNGKDVKMPNDEKCLTDLLPDTQKAVDAIKKQILSIEGICQEV